MLRNLFRERRRSDAIDGIVGPMTAMEPCFDRYVQAAALAFSAPIAALSLIHDDTHSIRASHGFEPICMPRGDGFCTHVLDRPGVLECCDPEGDDRFAHLPGVTGTAHFRYYIGAPLRLLSGIDVGALCVIDTVARRPAAPDQQAYLLGLARQASMALETRLDVLGNAA